VIKNFNETPFTLMCVSTIISKFKLQTLVINNIMYAVKTLLLLTNLLHLQPSPLMGR